MHQFKPKPLHPSAWWKSQPIGNLYSRACAGGYENLGPDSWIVAVAHMDEFCSPLSGYPITFPTATYSIGIRNTPIELATIMPANTEVPTARRLSMAAAATTISASKRTARRLNTVRIT